MAMFQRKMHSNEEFGENNNCHYDCEACTWPGIDLPAESAQEAQEAFNAHDCHDWINAGEIQGKLARFCE